MSEPLLEVTDLRIETSAGDPIVNGVTFGVDAGELLGLVGESGSGKTSTALALLGHARQGTRIARGTVRVRDQSVLSLSRQELQRLRGRHISYVPQDPTASLSPRQRVGTQMNEILIVHGESEERAASIVGELFERVGLPADRGFLRRYPFELSGGQQQRVMIAMALAWRPAVVVLDEPTTGVDVITQDQVLELLRDIRRDSTAAFVYVTHDLAVVSGLADKVAVMYAGSIVEDGRRSDVFEYPSHPYTRMLLTSAPRLSVRVALKGQTTLMPAPGARPEGCAFAPRCHLATEECTARPPIPVVGRGPGHVASCFHPVDGSLGGLHVLASASAAEDAAAAAAESAVLEIREVVASYGWGSNRLTAVRSVSALLQPGECMALVGQSGSGKSTLGRCVAGLHAPDSGAVLLKGKPLASVASKRSLEERRLIQIVFQNPERSLNPRQKVGNIIGRPLHLFEGLSGKAANRRTVDLLSRVRLPGSFINRYPGELSGGERQRVAIARALAARPSVLISDEITSALDVSTQASIIELLNSLQADGLAILFITHNLALVNSAADRLVVLEQGEVREVGDTAAVLSNPVHSYTRALLAAAPDMPAEDVERQVAQP